MPIARRLALTSPGDLHRELEGFVAADEAARLIPHLEQYLVKLNDLTAAEATLLHRLAGSATVLLNPDRSQALLAGTRAALEDAASHLRAQAPALAETFHRALMTSTSTLLRCRDRTLAMGDQTYVMGIINMTEDSFSGDGLRDNVAAAVAQGKRFLAEGATILDIGGESARADVPATAEAEEIRRVVPVIERLVSDTDALISIDTYKPAVAEAAVAAGAHIINDISGFKLGRGTAVVAARTGAALVLNYTYERPKVRPAIPPRYTDLMAETIGFLQSRITMAQEVGVSLEQLIIDPGIAFGKSHDEDLEALRRLPELAVLQRPVLVAASRKHVIGAVLGLPPAERLEGTAAVVALSIAGGADIVRVHDVRAMARVAAMADAIVRRRLGAFAASPTSWPWPAAGSP